MWSAISNMSTSTSLQSLLITPQHWLVSFFAVISNPAGASVAASGTGVVNWTDGILTGTGPAVALYPPNDQAYGFVVNTTGGLWYEALNSSGTSPWSSLGGVSTASPAAISWNVGFETNQSLRLDVFVRGTDGALWHKYYQNGWSNWESLGGILATGAGPAVSSWSANRLDVFVQGTDGQLWHKWWDGSKWSGWQGLGGKLTSSPAAASPLTNPSSNQIDVFVRGTDGAVWQKTYNISWSNGKSFHGQVAVDTGPAVTAGGDLFVQGTDQQLWQMYYRENGATWGAFSTEPPEALAIASPGAVMTDANFHPLLAVSSTGGNVWWSLRDSVGHWDQWYSAGSPT